MPTSSESDGATRDDYNRASSALMLPLTDSYPLVKKALITAVVLSTAPSNLHARLHCVARPLPTFYSAGLLVAGNAAARAA